MAETKAGSAINTNCMKRAPKWLVSGTLIDGVHHQYLTMNTDRRGSFTDVFRDSWETGIQPRQWSIVSSEARVLRGMHLHFGHDEYICVLRGRAAIGFYDGRQESATRGQHALIEVNGDSPACITFPRGVLHGWYFHEPSMHLQAISSTFDEYGSHDNWGCHFSDPELGIPWPDPAPILSDRARHFPALKQLEEILAAYRQAREAGLTPAAELTRHADTSMHNSRGESSEGPPSQDLNYAG